MILYIIVDKITTLFYNIAKPTYILRYFSDGIVVVGDGEIPFFRIINNENISEIDGLVFQSSSGAITKTGKRSASVLTDLDLLPWLDRTLLANEPFLKNGMKTMTFLGSRGCVGNCSFCITPAQYTVMKSGGAKRMRFRSMEDVVREVASLSDKLEVAQFIDDDMLPSSSRVRSFLQLWSKYGLAGTKDFMCLLRPDQIATYGANGLLDELHTAGLKKISLGIETGHDRGRHMVSANATGIDKKYRPETQIAAIQQCARVGIETKGFFVIGLPGETRAEIAQTLAFMRHLGDNGLSKAAIFPVKVYPNTQLWDHAVILGFTAEQLGHYDAPDVQTLISSGMDAKDASRDGFVQQIQLSEVPIDELNDVCQRAMQEFKNEGLK